MQRLFATALSHWYLFDGYAVGHGAGDLHDLPVDRLVSYIRWLLTKNMTEDQLAAFEAKLFLPPKGAAPAGPWAPEAETDALAQLRGGFG